MKTQKDIPYGISDFRTLILEKRYYVERTNFIEKMEFYRSKFLFFLRPRRFGKSLIISMLNYYYGIQYTEEFASLFSELYIGKNPTENRNKYYLLNFDFSGIDTATIDEVSVRFNKKILSGLEQFNLQYKLIDETTFSEIAKLTVPAETINDFFIKVQPHLRHKIFILIDEYDHFTNEILAFKFDAFSDAVSRNGFVRKFYEVIKTYTRMSIVDRFFATGITPVTLDSMTSGFNIATNISGDAKYNEMAGFTKEEVGQMIFDLFPGINDSSAHTILNEAEKWYNGSLFSPDSTVKLYNPAMVLRFVADIDEITLRTPRQKIDINVLSDYSKIGNLAKIYDYDANLEAVSTILKEDSYAAFLTYSYNFEQEFTVDDFISLLYYNGLLTIREPKVNKIVFEIPNQVIKEVYWSFFAHVLKSRYTINANIAEIENAVESMATESDIMPLMKIIENILSQLSNRDYLKFNEKYIKLLILVYVSLTRTYDLISEREVNKKYPDILFLKSDVFHPKYQHLFELKYLKKEDSTKLEAVKKAGLKQVRGYIALEKIKAITNMKHWLIIFTGDVCTECCEVTETNEI